MEPELDGGDDVRALRRSIRGGEAETRLHFKVRFGGGRFFVRHSLYSNQRDVLQPRRSRRSRDTRNGSSGSANLDGARARAQKKKDIVATPGLRSM